MPAKRKSKHQGRKKYAGYADRAKHLLNHVSIHGLDVDDAFECDMQYGPMIHPSKRKTLEEYALAAPMRWRIEAKCMARYADGSCESFVSEALTGQSLPFEEALELRHDLMVDACSTVNPRWIDSKTYTLRPII